MFYDIFLELCKDKGVKPARVARDIGINQSTISMWKSQKTTPNAATLVALAVYFNTTPAYLMGNLAAKDPDVRYRAAAEALPNATVIKEDGMVKFIDLERTRELAIKLFDELNAHGQSKALDYIQLLSDSSEYKNARNANNPP